MRIIPKRWDPMRFIRLGAKAYSQFSYDTEQSAQEDLHLVKFFNPLDEGSGNSGDDGIGKRGKALENEYFYREQRKLLKKLKERLKENQMKRARQNKKRAAVDNTGNEEKPETD